MEGSNDRERDVVGEGSSALERDDRSAAQFGAAVTVALIGVALAVVGAGDVLGLCIPARFTSFSTCRAVTTPRWVTVAFPVAGTAAVVGGAWVARRSLRE